MNLLLLGLITSILAVVGSVEESKELVGAAEQSREVYSYSKYFVFDKLWSLHTKGVSYDVEFSDIEDLETYFALLQIPITPEKIIMPMQDRLKESKEEKEYSLLSNLKEFEINQSEGGFLIKVTLAEDFSTWNNQKTNQVKDQFFGCLGVPANVDGIKEVKVENGSVEIFYYVPGPVLLAVGVGVGAYTIVNDAVLNDRQWKTLFTATSTVAATGTGAIIGTAVNPGIGTAIGAGVGFLTGIIGGAIAADILSQPITRVEVHRDDTNAKWKARVDFKKKSRKPNKRGAIKK